ncbi:hypothetical protein GQ42DRAFT_77061 [Ramicandelaber brevisporus]|nr:hypothetical protein GQ42DRAFT_77061 [Ramicandelaber brevisporus]
MKTDNADVTYTLEATITRSGRLEDGVKRILVTIPLRNHDTLLGATMAAPTGRSSPMELVLPQHHTRRGLRWTCTVAPGGCVYRGEQVTVNMTLTMPPHLKHAYVSNVFLALKERTVVSDDNGRERSVHIRYVSKTNNSELGYKDREYKVAGRIERPRTGMSDTCVFPPHISISHSLELNIFIGGVKNIEVETPLYFSSMTREEAQQVIAARGEATTTTTSNAAVAIDYSDAPPPYEIGDWIPNPPADVEGSALPPPAYDAF